MYDKDYVLKNKDKNVIGFWGIRGNDPYRFLSNFYPATFKAPLADNSMYVFTCSEQYFMYLKSITFNDLERAEKILINGKDGNYYKSLGRKVGSSGALGVKPFDADLWDSISSDVMKKVLIYKFLNKKMQRLLLETEDAILVEASKYDKRW